MPIPQIMSRIWDGDPNEYFTASDMRRVEDNGNVLARYAGVPEETFLPTDRSSQFRYDEAQRLEALTRKVATALKVPVQTEDHWGYGRTVTYVDFERWESQQWKLYRALGGVGERIPSDKFLHTVSLTLFAGDWLGEGPYWQDHEVLAIRDGMDAVAYVAESASVEERADEFNSRLQMVPTGPQKVRVWAYGIRPTTNIPVKVTTREFSMYKQILLKSSAWQGSGPWTQTVDLGKTVTNAVIGSDERNNAGQVNEMADAVVGVAKVSGTRVTIRAINKKPAVDVNATVMWSESAVV